MSATPLPSTIAAFQRDAEARIAEAQEALARLLDYARAARTSIRETLRPIGRDAESLSDRIAEDAEDRQTALSDDDGNTIAPDSYDADYQAIEDESNAVRDLLGEVTTPSVADAFGPIFDAIRELRSEIGETLKQVKAVRS